MGKTQKKAFGAFAALANELSEQLETGETKKVQPIEPDTSKKQPEPEPAREAKIKAVEKTKAPEKPDKNDDAMSKFIENCAVRDPEMCKVSPQTQKVHDALNKIFDAMPEKQSVVIRLDKLAEAIGMPRGTLANSLQKLKKAGYFTTNRGNGGKSYGTEIIRLKK